MSRKVPEIEPKSAETITFRGFVFLTKSNQLRTVEGKAVDLRSQSAEVLSALAARPGEIVSKEALMQAVWPDTFVTDDSLTQCIADIRRALGDDGACDRGNLPQARLPAECRSIGRGRPKHYSRYRTNQATILATRLHSCCHRSRRGSDRRLLWCRDMASRAGSFERHAEDRGACLRRHEYRRG